MKCWQLGERALGLNLLLQFFKRPLGTLRDRDLQEDRSEQRRLHEAGLDAPDVLEDERCLPLGPERWLLGRAQDDHRNTAREKVTVEGLLLPEVLVVERNESVEVVVAAELDDLFVTYAESGPEFLEGP